METHQLIYEQVIDMDQIGASDTRRPRIRVAVLDTGLDLGHPAIQANAERIKDIKSWLPPSESGRRQDSGDVSGHGTHITGLLLDIAPDCDVYIAQIADHQPISPDKIAKVKDDFTPFPQTLTNKF